VNSEGKSLSITSDEIFRMVRATWPQKNQGNHYKWSGQAERKYLKLSRQERLGIFTCANSAGLPLWSVAILPDQYIKSKPDPILKGEIIYEKQISILPLDAETIENHRGAMASIEEVKRQIAGEKQQAALDRDSRISNLRSTANVGTETSCGLIIQKRGTLVEVDLKAKYARNSGKDTAWLKVEDLLPDESREYCQLN